MTLSTQDYLSHDAMGLAALVRSGAVAPEAVLAAAMGRISALNPAINAVVETLYCGFRAESGQYSDQLPATVPI